MVIIVDDPVLIDKISERIYVLNRGNKPQQKQVTPDLERYALQQKEAFNNAILVVVFHGPSQVAWHVPFKEQQQELLLFGRELIGTSKTC